MTMCVDNTPLENHLKEFGLLVKREDMCCPPGPHFSKCRGVFRHVASRPEKLIGVLDTSHSQGGWAVAQACKALGKECVVYYPVYKARPDHVPSQQVVAQDLGARLIGLPAGRSAILYHRAKKKIETRGGYMMPNALKLSETVEETTRELRALRPSKGFDPRVWGPLIVSASSATIAAGLAREWHGNLIVHMGYSRSEEAVRSYIDKMVGRQHCPITVIDEGYKYSDKAKDGPTPPWPCNEFYDLKAFRWWMSHGRAQFGPRALFWNVG